MKQHPILFKAEMVNAILKGRKTQTRRIVKPQPDDSGLHDHTRQPMSIQSDLEGWRGTVDETGESREFKCPYGKVGDHLWVKETFAYVDFEGEDNGYVYRATDPDWETMEGWKWKPSIFMPRKASRITLEITDIRVERLNEIPEEDCYAEGITNHKFPFKAYERLWESINGEGSWKLNPWVWVVSFIKL